MKPAVLIALGLVLTACEKRDPVADEADNTTGLPTINKPAPNASGEPPVNAALPATPDAIARTPAASIPAALHGRWGLTPADCTSTRGDAKGLIIVTADGVQFYESRAIPVRNVNTSGDSISADFAFTGEGQSWTKYQALQIEREKLVRTESSPMASFTYARCK